MKSLNYIDLFAGAGGLSEGFIRQGFDAIAHVEMNKEASDTLRTRLAFHHLVKEKKTNIYFDYLQNKILRPELWKSIPQEIIDFVISLLITESIIS